jgi:membrane-associated phospholipid phosphatase
MEQTAITDREAAGAIFGLIAALLIFWKATWFGAKLTWRGARAGLDTISDLPLPHRPVRDWLERKLPRLYGLIAPRLDPTHFTGLPLTLCVLAGVYMLFLVGGLTDEVFDSREAIEADRQAFALVDDWRHPWLVEKFTFITDLASIPTMTAVAIVTTGFLWTRGPRFYIAPVWLTVIGSQITTYFGKFFIDRARPDFVLEITAATPSFPSGHTTGAMAVYGIVAYAILRDFSWPRGRFEIAFWTGVLIALIGFSRIFLGVHYATDVAAGFLVGGFWLLAGIALAESTRVATGQKLSEPARPEETGPAERREALDDMRL